MPSGDRNLYQKVEAIELLRARWAGRYPFDLNWETIAETSRPTSMLEASKLTLKFCRSMKPEIVAGFYMNNLDHLEGRQTAWQAVEDEWASVFTEPIEQEREINECFQDTNRCTA